MKKKIVILLVIILIIVGIQFYIENNKETASTNANEQTQNIINQEFENTNIDQENIKEHETSITQEIQIYDIEEGYLTVPFNRNASLHNYNWDKLSSDFNGYYSYTDESFYTKLGVDVSTFQGEINWKKVKNTGIDFAILRLGFRGYGSKGNIVLDDCFEENAKLADEAGIAIGVYFFSQAITEAEAVEEANYVLDNIKDKNITYPICFDLEKIKFDTARTDNLTADEITKITNAFCEEIEKAGYDVLIYGNAKTFTTRMNLEQLNNYQKWYADYQEEPLYPYDFSFWQYTEKGEVPGINGYVDLNIQFIQNK